MSAVGDAVEAKHCNVSENINEIWLRLDEKFDDEDSIRERVLKDIKHFRPIKKIQRKTASGVD